MADAFNIKMEVSNQEGLAFEEVEVVVGTGALLTILPSSLLERLSVVADGEQAFVNSQGQEYTRSIGNTKMRLQGMDRPNLVVFGDEDEFILGDVTIHIFGLKVDPTRQVLVSAPIIQATTVLL